ncbi:MAG: ABC transporter permease subunit, partial [Ignavibacteriaceae bacterium]
AVKTGKADAAIYITQTLMEMVRKDNSLTIVGETLFSSAVGMGFNKNSDELREKFNEFLMKIKKDGTYDDIIKRWVNEGSTDMPQINNSKDNGILNVGIMGDKGLPFAVVKNNQFVGVDIEFAERFAAYLGKELKLSPMDFGSLIAAAAAGKIDMISCTVVITEERKKQIDFSDPYLKLGASLFALKKNAAALTTGRMKTLSDFAEKRIGVYAGTVHDRYVEEHYPKADVLRFNFPADLILSLKTGKIDVTLMDYFSAKVLLKSNPDIGILPEDPLSLPVGIGFNKNNPALRQEFNDYLKEIRADGTYDVMYKRWFIDDPEKAVMPEFNLEQNKKLIKLSIAVGDLPNSAVVNGKHVGFDIELLKRFAERRNYNLKISIMEFSALIAALASGKADMIADGICITEERMKMVDFSDPYNKFGTAILVMNKNILADAGDGNISGDTPAIENNFLHNVAESFYNNIILENRYLLIIDGLKVTAIISILSTIFGTLLGGLVCFMRMAKRKILVIPARVYISILRGTPVLVILMIIFYVVFAAIDIDPVLVAVFAFGLNFAAYSSEMFRSGIEGIDRGQTEAGIALGFSKVKTFIYIILPQAVKRILPVYKGEIISLVKMTSIVGYIAVQDLTKASDIIRSRTFDAFFPLIMVAVLYYLISWLLMILLGYTERKSNPKLTATPEIS